MLEIPNQSLNVTLNSLKKFTLLNYKQIIFIIYFII